MSCGNYGGYTNDSCSGDPVQDKVCVNAQRLIASGEGGSTQIYVANTTIDSTGFFKVVASTDPTASYTLHFFLNGIVQSVATIDPVYLHETLAFTITEFDEIRVTSSLIGTTLTYELSLTPRYS